MTKQEQEIAVFLKTRVIGKTLATEPLVYSLENGRLEGVYSDQMIFGGLYTSEAGFYFDLSVIAKETVYELGADGSRAGVNRDYNGVSVFRYEMAERRSTSEITGIMRLISSTVKDHTVAAMAYGLHRVRLSAAELCWEEKQLLYRDMTANEGGYRPVALDSTARFFLKDARLHFEFIPTVFDIDPATLERTEAQDKWPSFIAKEQP
ncbi:hypothetical protein EDC14_100920 [Hydrogenispora ethanolica]|uniref:Uncharacterized protein n=1 Tax=Hydrogenispora ethanolica TaxID=1082276 RepID=A0A4R1RVL5_HYDET|nr:hypothetical protein [Hydrogenispora ethanolica]TCL70703.1 hypothetical protein EDC14_100920 [Hydrogenispora ethanolica]